MHCRKIVHVPCTNGGRAEEGEEGEGGIYSMSWFDDASEAHFNLGGFARSLAVADRITKSSKLGC